MLASLRFQTDLHRNQLCNCSVKGGMQDAQYTNKASQHKRTEGGTNQVGIGHVHRRVICRSLEQCRGKPDIERSERVFEGVG